MSKYIMCISLEGFIKYTIGEIYCLAPNHKPRAIDEITSEIITRFKDGCEQIGDNFFYHSVELKDLKQFISDILMPIDKFRELNLSQREVDAGVSVGDSTRAEFVFVDRYTSIPEYDNFIDLDACIQNVFSSFESIAFNKLLREDEDHALSDISQFREAYNSGDVEEENKND